MTDERRDERTDWIVSEVVRREYGEAEVPREAMWAAIEADRVPARTPSRSRFRWAAALAAAAIVAAVLFGVTHYGDRAPDRNGPSVVPTVEAIPVDPDDLILRGHLARTGTLLETVAAGDAPTRADAAPLLARTRVLLDDPALAPSTARLLADAEIALALLVRSGGAEVKRIALRETVADGRLAARLRVASGVSP